jgi:diguanylate cyclase (GGDEF)-like protein/PAS domain S-box-containing protein
MFERQDRKHQVFRTARAEWTMFGALLVLTGVMMGYFVWNERQLLIASNVERMRLQTLIIDENLTHQLEGVRSALNSARHTLAADSACDDGCRRILLQSLERAVPGVRALEVVDRAGAPVLTTAPPAGSYPAPPLTASDADTLYMSLPYEITPGVFNLKLTMAVPGGGAVSAVLNPAYLDAVMRSALYAPDMNSAITENGGRRMLYVPADPVAMRREAAIADTFVRRHLGSRLAESVLAGTTGAGEQRLVVQRSMRLAGLRLDRSLVVSLGRSQAVIDAGWHRLAWTCGLAWLLFAATAGVSMAVLQRRRRVHEDAARAWADAQSASAQKVEAALDGASLGLWEWDMRADFRSVDVRGAEMLGYTSDDKAALNDWRRQIHPEDLPGLDIALAEHLAGNSQRYDIEYRIRHRGGHWVWLQSRGTIVERAADGAPLRMLGTRMDISQRKEAEARITHLAFYDGLTQLPNRRLLMDRLHHAIAKSARTANHGAVLFIDLDNFKSLNDTMGHDMGDYLLQMVAQRLQQVTRSSDTVARLGGDEFVILLEDLGDDEGAATAGAAAVASKVLEALSSAYVLDGHDVRTTPSIGVVLFGAGPHAIGDLLRHADMAMYEAKADGRATWRFFDPRMQQALDASAALEADLRLALIRQQLYLSYQPVVDRSARVTGVEALLRWSHPQRGEIGPAEFIPQAEKSELILELGEWVLEAACLQLVHWAASAPTAHLTMAVNVSARQFRQPGFIDQVLMVLQRTGADPRLLKLELTESMLLTDMDDVIGKMAALRAHGVGFALDDFGTGYSSLRYLKLLPIDLLKIDRSFVQDMLHSRHAASIVRAIVNLAYSLDLAVVAEGVETREQWTALEAIGCTAFQGYLFGRPAPILDADSMVGYASVHA